MEIAGGAASDSDAREEDWALLSLLVAPPANGPDAASRTLEAIYRRLPSNPFYATNYAFSLWRLGWFQDACAVADRLSDADRAMPFRAPYLAVIYASAGRPRPAPS